MAWIRVTVIQRPHEFLHKSRFPFLIKRPGLHTTLSLIVHVYLTYNIGDCIGAGHPLGGAISLTPALPHFLILCRINISPSGSPVFISTLPNIGCPLCFRQQTQTVVDTILTWCCLARFLGLRRVLGILWDCSSQRTTLWDIAAGEQEESGKSGA